MSNSELFSTFETYLQEAIKTIDRQNDRTENTVALRILAVIVDLVQLLPDRFRPLKPFEALLMGHSEAKDEYQRRQANQLKEQIRELCELH